MLLVLLSFVVVVVSFGGCCVSFVGECRVRLGDDCQLLHAAVGFGEC